MDANSEARFRSSHWNKDCLKSPGLWHADLKLGTEVEVIDLLFGLVRALQPDFILETGTAFGTATVPMAKALQQNGHGRMVTIEPNLRRFRWTRKQVRGLPVQCLHCKALEWKPNDGDVIDLFYCDSEYDSRPHELDHFRPWMNDHTIVVWHDTGTQHPVLPLIEKYISEGRISAVLLPTPRGVCISRLLK